MRESVRKHLKRVFAFAIALAVGAAFMPAVGSDVYAAGFSTSGAVKGLTVTAYTSSTVTLKWNAYDGASGYQVYKARKTNGKYERVKTTKSTSFKRTGLMTNLTCYYKVRAYKVSGGKKIYSKFSSLVAGTPKGFSQTKGVSGLKTAGYTSSTVTLKWDSFYGASGYQVYKARKTNGKYERVKTTKSTSFKRTGLTTNLTCYYKVRAYKVSGGKKIYSKFSSPVAGTPKGFSKTAKVSGLKTIASTYNSVTLRWDSFYGASGYQVYKARKTNGKYERVKTTTATSFKRTNLTTDLRCYYKVRAYKVSGGKKIYSEFSSLAAGTPKLGVPATTVSSQSSKVYVSWTAVPGASGYQVYRATSQNGKYSCVKTLTGRSFSNTSVTKDKVYYYKVRAYRTVNGSKKYSSFSSAQQGAKASVATVSGVSASSKNTCVALTWNNVSGATGYQIYRATGANGSYTRVGTSGANSFNDSNVANGLTYYYKIRAYKKIGSSTIYGSFSSQGYSRSKVVSTAVAWLGCKESNRSNEPIVKLYNSNMGTNFNYKTPWCAIFVSAVAIKSGTTKIIVKGSYCPTVMNTYKDSRTNSYKYGSGSRYTPKAGDVIFFDWNRNGVPDHTGLVASVSGKTVKTIEGNYNDAVGYRTFSVGNSTVLGYGLPNYDDANGIVYTGKSSTSVGCGELAAVGIGTEPEGYEDLGEEYDFVEQKVEDNVGCEEEVSEYDKMVYIVKKVRANAETEAIDCSESQYYTAFVYKLCQEADLDASIMTTEDEEGNINSWVEALLDGKWYKVYASQETEQLVEFTPEVTDVEE